MSSAMRLLPGGVLVVMCSVLTTVAPFSSSFYGDTGCGVSGWPVPEPPGGAKLSQVHAIIRSPARPSLSLASHTYYPTACAAGTVTGLLGRETRAGRMIRQCGSVTSTVPKYPCTITRSMGLLSPDSIEKVCNNGPCRPMQHHTS